MTGKTSAERLEAHIAGRLVAGSAAPASRDVIVQIFARDAVQEGFLVPAVAEPLIVWILEGSARVEGRDLGGDWLANDVAAGDFFLTDSEAPYELRWRSRDGTPFAVMHLHLGLPLLERAAKAVHGIAGRPALRDVSGGRDAELAPLLQALAHEVSGQAEPSALLLEGIAQAVAVHLVRRYADPDSAGSRRRGAKVVAEDIDPAVKELGRDGLASLVADVSRDGTAEAAVAMAVERFGTLDILVNNAGRILYKPLVEMTREEWNWQMETNVTGAFLHSREAAKVMMARRAGAIVNIASYASYVAFPGIAAFLASDRASFIVGAVVMADGGMSVAIG